MKCAQSEFNHAGNHRASFHVWTIAFRLSSLTNICLSNFSDLVTEQTTPEDFYIFLKCISKHPMQIHIYNQKECFFPGSFLRQNWSHFLFVAGIELFDKRKRGVYVAENECWIELSLLNTRQLTLLKTFTSVSSLRRGGEKAEALYYISKVQNGERERGFWHHLSSTAQSPPFDKFWQFSIPQSATRISRMTAREWKESSSRDPSDNWATLARKNPSLDEIKRPVRWP